MLQRQASSQIQQSNVPLQFNQPSVGRTPTMESTGIAIQQPNPDVQRAEMMREEAEMELALSMSLALEDELKTKEQQEDWELLVLLL